MADVQELQQWFSFQNISVEQAMFWYEKGVTFTVKAGKVIPQIEK